MQTQPNATINYNKRTINSQTMSLYTNKIRSGQTFLYREGGCPSMVLEVRMKEDIGGISLEQAFQKAILRYPYLTCKLVEKNGDFYLSENSLPFRLEETNELHSLGGPEVNFHLIDITYKGKSVYISYHHGLCDGRGIMPFVRTLIHYYCKQKYKTNFNIQNVRLAGEPFLTDETSEPISKSMEVNETKLPKIYKNGFSLPENENSPRENKTYRYEIKINHDNFVKYAKEIYATPVIAVSLLASQAIRNIFPDTDKSIICNLACDLRGGVGMEHTFRNCVGSISLPYSPEFAELTMKEQAMTYRKIIKEYRKNENLKNELNKQANLFDRLDSLPSYEEKKKLLSFFNNLVSDTFILSYAGQVELGDYEKYIDSLHTYTSGTTGVSMQMLSAGDYITINFMQSFTSDIYMNAFAKIMEKSGLEFSISDQMEYTVPKDSIKSN